MDADGTQTGTTRTGRPRRSDGTRRAILTAARQLFRERGYDNTAISDIVALSGISVGSIYHQFGEKREIFHALTEESFTRHVAVSEAATQRTRARGETDPLRLYVAGAKAFLLDAWRERDLDRITIAFGAADFSARASELDSRFVRGAIGIRIGSPPTPDASAQALVALARAAALQLVQIEDERMAKRVINYFTDLMLRLATPGESR